MPFVIQGRSGDVWKFWAQCGLPCGLVNSVSQGLQDASRFKVVIDEYDLCQVDRLIDELDAHEGRLSLWETDEALVPVRPVELREAREILYPQARRARTFDLPAHADAWTGEAAGAPNICRVTIDSEGVDRLFEDLASIVQMGHHPRMSDRGGVCSVTLDPGQYGMDIRWRREIEGCVGVEFEEVPSVVKVSFHADGQSIQATTKVDPLTLVSDSFAQDLIRFWHEQVRMGGRCDSEKHADSDIQGPLPVGG